MKDVIITGAFGGMGYAAAKLLSKNGFRVFAIDKKIGEPSENIIPIEADITSEAALKAAYGTVSSYTQSVFAVIHYAGIYMLDSLVEMDTTDFRRIFDINLYGAYLVNKTFVPMIEKGGRVMITTSELAPIDPLPFTGIYAITKSALDKYAYSLAMELQLSDIHVSVLRAGATETGMLGASFDALDRFIDKTERYSCNAKRFKNIVDSVESRSVPSEKIAEKTYKILRKRKPSFAYSINRNPLLLAFGILPKRMQLWVIRLILKNS